VLDQPDERQRVVADVGPVERRELAVELDQQAERREVLDPAQLGQVGLGSRPGASSCSKTSLGSVRRTAS
jgi:hypothetical protein